MRRPKSGLLTEQDLFLFLDYYELTSGRCNFDFGMNQEITENYFFREIPEHLGSYVTAAGLEQFASYIEILNRGLSAEHRDWLKQTGGRDFVNGAYLNYLQNFKFKGDVYAIPEGTPVFPDEPIINVSGPSIDVQLFETYLLNVINFESLIATKTSRIVQAAEGRGVVFTPEGLARSVIDFGARRAHGRDAAVLGARAAYIGGATGTSLVIAGMKWGIPYVGTMPHKFIQERHRGRGTFKEAELLAFRQYIKSFPHNTIMLVDTYDSIEGVRNAVIIGRELRERGYPLRGIRLDSGDPLELSKRAKEVLGAEFENAKIFVSNNLDEYAVSDMLEKGAPVSGFGVGTRLVTGANYNSLTGEGAVSALNGVYKFAENTDETGKRIPSMKFTSDKEKATLPGKKQVWRRYRDGKYLEDIITLWDEKVPDAQPLLVPIIVKGELVYDFPELEHSRRYAMAQLAALPEEYKELSGGKVYPVKISDALRKLRDELFEQYCTEYAETAQCQDLTESEW
ncbi:MAG: nicotinate phosphoribosyltransferase [Chloroflexi bacterium]|nr:nicotinate phosphoribosyltransferase [Chloroflexota bacterium]